jgi:hypothetical protein
MPKAPVVGGMEVGRDLGREFAKRALVPVVVGVSVGMGNERGRTTTVNYECISRRG